MKQLSREAFDRARDFIKARARPLDRALFAHRFEGASVDLVTAELARFQNDDGGFGHALEPDVRTPTSSALATEIGLRTLQELGCASDHPMVARAVRFLLETIDPRTRVWRVIPPDANAHPHAPWWHDGDGSLARTFDDFLIIPRASVVGLLHHYAALVPVDWLAGLTEHTVATLEAIADDAFAGGGDSLRYALHLVETKALPRSYRGRLVPRLCSLSRKFVSCDPQEWGGYVAAPLKVAPTPDSLVADELRAGLEMYLDYLIDHQAPEGAWEPTWTWGDFYPDVWERAKLEWRGELTLRMLTALRAFDRIEKSGQ
ncbi:MAG: hypothetical protein JW918_05690 [Anaerolineae bacterium]|nr:hypothetical protein [Anaerolineae bacterium]